MNWFEEQIEARQKNDEDALQDAYEAAANAIIGDSFSFNDSEDALLSIASFYHISKVKIDAKAKDDTERFHTFCRNTGLMPREVKLEKGWYKNTFGAYLCRLRESGEYVACLPNAVGHYYFYDKVQQKRITLNAKTEQLLCEEGICFYASLPAKKLLFTDVMKFIFFSLQPIDYILVLVMLGIVTLVGLLVPTLTNFIFEDVLDQGSVSLLVSTMVFVICLTSSLALLDGMKNIYTNIIGVKVQAIVQSATMIRVLSLPQSFFRNYTTGELTTRMGYMNSVFITIFSSSFVTMITSVFSLTFVTQIFHYAPSLVIPSLCIILANVLFSIYSTIRQIRISKTQMELSAKVNGESMEMISGIQKIKLAGAEKRMFAKFTKDFSKQAKVIYNPPFFNKYSSVVTTTISLVGTLVLYFCAVQSAVSVSQYYAFQSAYATMSAAFTGLVSVALQIANLKPSLEMISPLLKESPEESGKEEAIASLTGAIEINRVSFRYEEESANVIDDFSLRIRAGDYVAIVGKTGCGKSTLVRLILGLEKPQKGSIYYDNKDLSLIDKRSLRRKIGTVMQDDKLFTGDLYSNIVICEPTLSLEDAWQAAEIAGIADDIREMPMQMQTVITEGGGGISGGQRQRLAIARAIAPKPKILIFDEATSALDNITQKKIAESLNNLKCTRIVIAHRLSTIRECNRILVMDKGKIIAEGTYDELLKTCPFFAELVDRQRLDK